MTGRSEYARPWLAIAATQLILILAIAASAIGTATKGIS